MNSRIWKLIAQRKEEWIKFNKDNVYRLLLVEFHKNHFQDCSSVDDSYEPTKVNVEKYLISCTFNNKFLLISSIILYQDLVYAQTLCRTPIRFNFKYWYYITRFFDRLNENLDKLLEFISPIEIGF